VRFGIIVLPGTWSDRDCYHALHIVLGQDAQYIWHKETDLAPYDCIIVPGGFSYGDYLRPGAIARFSPVMSSLQEFANHGRMVIGICNGFQILCECGLLPGVLMRNDHLQFRCQWTHLRVNNNSLPFTAKCHKGQVIRIPISHYEGNYYVDDPTLEQMESNGQIVFRYCSPEGEITAAANPNGSSHNIAGVCNQKGNVLGMMPHPERACEDILGGSEGLLLFKSLVEANS